MSCLLYHYSCINYEQNDLATQYHPVHSGTKPDQVHEQSTIGIHNRNCILDGLIEKLVATIAQAFDVGRQWNNFYSETVFSDLAKQLNNIVYVMH